MLRLFKKNSDGDQAAEKPSLEVAESARYCGADEIASFIERLAREYFLDGPDKRVEPRFQLTVPAVLELLDENRQPLGRQVRAVTRDVSPGGAGFVCQDPVHAPFVAVRLATRGGNEIETVARVLRCRPMGYYFDVGCQFETAIT